MYGIDDARNTSTSQEKSSNRTASEQDFAFTGTEAINWDVGRESRLWMELWPASLIWGSGVGVEGLRLGWLNP